MKNAIYDAGGKAIVAGTEAHSDMHKKCLILRCIWLRPAIAFLKDDFATIPISKCLGEL